MSETKTIPLTKNLVAIVDAADFEWLNQWNWFAITGRRNKSPYAARHLPRRNGKQRTILMHRQILNAEPDTQVDHKDENGLNNTRDNLRIATGSQNHHNRTTLRNNTSGYKGVTWHKECRKWHARISHNGKQRSLGLHHNAEDAARAYDLAARELYGEYANTNF